MQEGIAIHMVQLITVGMKKEAKKKISYLNINYIYRMCNSWRTFYICN